MVRLFSSYYPEKDLLMDLPIRSASQILDFDEAVDARIALFPSGGTTTDLELFIEEFDDHIPATLGTGDDQNYRSPTPAEIEDVVTGLWLIAQQTARFITDIDTTAAAALLTPHGFTITKGYDSVSYRPYVLVYSEPTYPNTVPSDVGYNKFRAWGVFLFDMSQPLSMILEAPHPQTDGNSELITLKQWRKTPGALYILSAVNRKAQDYMTTEISTDHTGGTYTLNVLGLGTTVGLAPNAAKSTVQAAIETIVGVGNVIVTGDLADTSLHMFVNLSGNLYNSGTPTNTITVGTNSLSGGTFLTLDHDADAAHNYTSIFNKVAETFATKGPLQLQMHGFNDTSSGVARCFNAILSPGSSNSTKLSELIRTSLESAGFDVGLRDSSATLGLYFTGTSGSTTGTFTLTLNAETTAAITYSTNITTLAANVQAAIIALTSILPDDVQVTVSQNNNGSIPALVITYKSLLYHTGYAITIGSNSLSGGAAPVILTANGTALTAQSNTQGDIAEAAGTTFLHLELSETVRNSATLSAKVVKALTAINLPLLAAAALPAGAESGHSTSQAPQSVVRAATTGVSPYWMRADARIPWSPTDATAGNSYIAARSSSNSGNVWTAPSTAFNNGSPMTTQGDIIYGGTAGAATRLPAGTSSQVLTGGTSPAWGAVALASMVSGTLPIANGGTGSATKNFVDLTTVQASIAGAKTFTSDMTIPDASITVGSTTDVFLAAYKVLRNNVVTGQMDNNNNGLRLKANAGGNVQIANSTDTMVEVTDAGNVILTDGVDFVLASGVGTQVGTAASQKLAFYGAAPVVQQTGGAATAGAIYTAAEQAMIQTMYDALRAYGLLS